jgi:hypothetical protein
MVEWSSPLEIAKDAGRFSLLCLSFSLYHRAGCRYYSRDIPQGLHGDVGIVLLGSGHPVPI